MYPILKVARVLLCARFRKPLEPDEISVLNYRVGLFDADAFLELNNARYLFYTELGRWDYCWRVGFFTLMRAKGWGVSVGGASVRYRRRIPFGRKFSVRTKLVCHDGRWFYFLHEFTSKGRICASALIKACAVSKQGLVPATEVIDAIGKDFDDAIPDWVNAWIEAEGLRPWPKHEPTP